MIPVTRKNALCYWACVFAVVLLYVATVRAADVLEIIPSTQPAQEIDGVLVQPAPTVRMSNTEDPWGIVKIIVGVAGVIAAIRMFIVPALRSLLKDVLEIKSDVAKVTERTKSQDDRLDRQGEDIKRMSGTGDGKPPGADSIP